MDYLKKNLETEARNNEKYAKIDTNIILDKAKAHLRYERFQETSYFATKTNFDVTNRLFSGILWKKYVFVYEK